MTTHFIFIRHASSTWNETRRWQGHANPPLGDQGRFQAQLLAARLANWQIDYLYTSDLSRAVETASIIGNKLGLEPMIDPLWRERGFGVLEGLTSEEIEARYPDIWASRMMGPLKGIPRAEGQEDVVARAAAGSSALVARHPGKTVAVVSHGGMILTTLVYLLGAPPVWHAMLNVGRNTAISQIIVDCGSSRLISLNDAAHLEFAGV